MPCLTFEDLDRWLDEEEIHLAEMDETPEDHFEPEEAEEGALYPIEGGMVPGVSDSREGEQFAVHVILWSFKC